MVAAGINNFVKLKQLSKLVASMVVNNVQVDKSNASSRVQLANISLLKEVIVKLFNLMLVKPLFLNAPTPIVVMVLFKVNVGIFVVSKA